MNSYCFFYKNKDLTIGLIKEKRKNNKILVLPRNGSEAVLTQSQLEFEWTDNGALPADSEREYLESKFSQIETQAGSIDLSVIWELCESEGKQGYELKYLAENFLEENEEPWMMAALFLGLKKTSRLFRHKRNEFIPLTAKEVEEFDTKKEKEQLEAKRQELEKIWMDALQKNQSPLVDSEQEIEYQEFCDKLFDVAKLRSESKYCSAFEKGMKTRFDDDLLSDNILLEALGLVGHHMSWGKLRISMTGIDRKYSEQALAEVIDINAEYKKSVEGFGTSVGEGFYYTVDSEDTLDYDDAVGFETTIDGHHIIKAYITNIAPFISSDSHIWKECERRISSVYTIRKKFSMLPEELSTGTFSLIQHEPKNVLTFYWKIDSELNILDQGIINEVISISKNMTYEELDELFEKGGCEKWEIIRKFSEKLKSNRLANGALNLHRLEIKLDISVPDHIQLIEFPKRSGSRLLIEELAIATNCLSAETISDKNVHGLFRTQSPYQIQNKKSEHTQTTELSVSKESENQLAQIHTEESSQTKIDLTDNNSLSEVDNTVIESNIDQKINLPEATDQVADNIEQSDASIEKKVTERGEETVLTINDIFIRSAVIAIQPDRHSGLGVDKYMQTSSPIRRFQDLLNQKILIGVISGEEYEIDELTLLSYAKNIEYESKGYNRLERNLLNHWKFKYLSQNLGVKLKAQFQRILKSGQSLVSFPELDLMHEINVKGLPDEFEAQILEVDSKRRKINFEIIESE